MITAKKALKTLLQLSRVHQKEEELKALVSEIDLFDDIEWSYEATYTNCTIKDGVLYSESGNKLSTDGRCMSEDIPYFVNQHTGYCCDDFYGTMYIKVNDMNTFVAISFEC